MDSSKCRNAGFGHLGFPNIHAMVVAKTVHSNLTERRVNRTFHFYLWVMAAKVEDLPHCRDASRQWGTVWSVKR